MTTPTSFSTVVDVQGQSITVTCDTLIGLSAAVAETRRYFRVDDPPATATSTPTAPPTASPTSTPTCIHGARAHKSGTSAAGKPWAGWFCPLPRERKDEQCKPQWDAS